MRLTPGVLESVVETAPGEVAVAFIVILIVGVRVMTGSETTVVSGVRAGIEVLAAPPPPMVMVFVQTGKPERTNPVEREMLCMAQVDVLPAGICWAAMVETMV